MRILGIDPGTARMGYAIVDLVSNNEQKLVTCGVIETSKLLSDAERLHEIRTDLLKIQEHYQPEVLAIEKLFFFRNLTTIVPVAQARGIVLEIAAATKMKIFEYTPLQVKQILTGDGKADKNLVEKYVAANFNLTYKIKPDDAVDAVAIALCFVRLDLAKINQ
jgi:crossover junction endodeoxyribonuclease RuvC